MEKTPPEDAITPQTTIAPHHTIVRCSAITQVALGGVGNNTQKKDRTERPVDSSVLSCLVI